MFLVPEIITLNNSIIYSSLLYYSSMLSKVKWVINKNLILKAPLEVLDVNSDYYKEIQHLYITSSRSL